MSTELQSLSQLFQNRLFRIPDCQRDYARTQPQLAGYWGELINMQPDRYRYAGTVSLKPLNETEVKLLGEDLWLIDNGFKPYHIVHGQQRITTFVILINEIVLFVRNLKENCGKPGKDIFLGFETVDDIVSKYICMKRPTDNILTTYILGYEADNPGPEYMRYKVFEEPFSGNIEETNYKKNLKLAKEFFANNIKEMFESSGENGLAALNCLYNKLTLHMMFNICEIDDDYNLIIH
jgi:uncharacterized protein with ParB-like and HNH nuclease domain